MIFDKDAKIVLELSSTAGNQFQNEVRDALKTLNYRGSRSDLASAVERAIYELRVQSRPDSRRDIVFVTDGVLDLGTESVTAAKTRWLRDDLGLEAKRSDVSIFTVAVSQAADFQVAQTLARTTGGEYYRAPSPPVFTTALEQVTERLTKMVEIGGVRSANPIDTKNTAGPDVFGRRVLLVPVILIGLVVLCLAIVFARKRTMRSGPGDVRNPIEEVPPVPSLSALRERGVEVSRALTAATDLLTKANSTVNQLQAAVDCYALSSFKVLQAADEQSFTLARECVLLLDHLDIMIHRARERGEPINSLSDARRRLCSLLETAQIEEIPVNAGDVFDGTIHVATSAVGSSGPEGVVVEVSRRGYTMKVSGRSDVLVRAADVTVSAGHAELKPASGGLT
jgi:molecular chaperone GrpE (heat shock protein)